jgi:hypothetical protein
MSRSNDIPISYAPWLAGSVRDRAIETNLAKSSAPIDNSIACRHAVMIFHPRRESEARVQATNRVNPPRMIGFMESMN